MAGSNNLQLDTLEMYLIFWIIVFLGHCHIISSGVGYYQMNVVGKDTKQSSTEHNGVSSRAVDGDSNSDFFGGESCTHTGRDPPGAWWAVDLGKQYQVHSVGLVNRDFLAHRLNKFTIYGTDLAFDPDESTDKKTCYTFDGDFGPGETKDLNCTALMNYRFVGIRLNHNEKLTLCEVYVYVACDNGSYGEDCQDECSVNCLKTPCDRVTGVCPDGECKAGYTGDTCKKECGIGTFGDRCMYNCSKHCKYQCDSTSEIGKCIGGCMAGYKGEACDTECDPSEYGENCALNCSINCKKQACNSIDGFCTGDKSSGFEQNTPPTGTSVVALSVVVAVLAVLCVGLIIFITVGKVKAMRTRKNGVSRNQATTNLGSAYENVSIEATGEGQTVEPNKSQKTDDETLNLSSRETYERINNGVRYTNDDQAQTYQELKI